MSFAVDVGKFSTGAVGKIERTRRGVFIKLAGTGIADTPVLTGRLRGNWQSSVASPLTGELPLRPEFDGWSCTKAPAGMLRKNVVRFQRIVGEAAREGREA